MKKVALTEVELLFAEYLRQAEEEEVVITHEGSRPAYRPTASAKG